MNEGTRNQLNVELRKMLEQLDQAGAEQEQPMRHPGTGNIIRRRKGERDERFFTCTESK